MSRVFVSKDIAWLDPLYLFGGQEVNEWKICFGSLIVMELEDGVVKTFLTSDNPYLTSVTFFLEKLKMGYRKACNNPDQIPMKSPKSSTYKEQGFPLFL